MEIVANRPLVTLTGRSHSNLRHNRADFRHKVADRFFTQLSRDTKGKTYTYSETQKGAPLHTQPQGSRRGVALLHYPVTLCRWGSQLHTQPQRL